MSIISCCQCNYRKILCLVVFFTMALIVLEFAMISNNEGEYIDSMQDHISNFEEDMFYDNLEHNLNLKKPAAYAAKHRLPIILWWTHFTGGNSVKRCSLGECYITEARKFKSHPRTKGFLFYGTNFKASDLPLPRLVHHEWGLFHEESPKNNPILHHQNTIELFNHTSTFRLHSDYPIVTQFLNSLDELLSKPLFPLSKKSQNGLASIIYIQSGCDPPSDRDAYVRELMKYIKIDSYGKCLHNKDLPAKYIDPLTMDDKGFHHFVAQYKFTLSMENAICDEYITEKLWRPMILGSVPIYHGSPNVNDWMPNNHSVILVNNFKHPKDLAKYIAWLDQNDKAYLKYLEYKDIGVTNKKLINFMKNRQWGHNSETQENFVTGFECLVCDRIHENLKFVAKGLPPKVHIANQSHYGCPAPVMFHFSSDDHALTDRNVWLQEYNQSKLQSKQLKERIIESTPATLKMSF